MPSTSQDLSCLAVDMGAGSIRIMRGGISAGAVFYEEVHRFENRIRERDGHQRWDMEGIVTGILKGISKALEMPGPSPDSIGVDSWGADYVLLDKNGERVEEPVSYRDARTEGMDERWTRKMTAEETFRRTGINFYPFNTLFQLMAAVHTPAWARAASLLFTPCYINYLLTGSGVNELTIASTSQLLEISGSRWDREICSLVPVRPSVLGEVTGPGTRLGPVRIPEVSGRKLEGVAVCGHDTACVVAAIPASVPEFAFISAGTWCIVGVEAERPVLDEEAFRLGFTNERGIGGSYRVLRNIVGLWLVQGLRESFPEGTSYAEMDQRVAGCPPAGQLVDPDDPLFYHPQSMISAFDAFFRKTGQPIPAEPEHYLNCAYDSLCFSFLYHVEKLESFTNRKIEALHVVGGGSRSPVLNQRIADCCRREVWSGPVEAATLGNILIQAHSLGRLNSLEEGRKIVAASPGIERYRPGVPSPESERLYTRFRKWKEPT